MCEAPSGPLRGKLDLSPFSAGREPVACYLRGAQMLVRRSGRRHTVVSGARGGVFKHFAPGRPPVTDAGLILQTSTGRVAVSQWFDPQRSIEPPEDVDLEGSGRTGLVFSVSGPLGWARFQTATPLAQAVFHAGMCTAGRWCRTLVRRLLQRLLITGRRRCPIRLTRTFEFPPEANPRRRPRLRVTDTIELLSRRIRVRRMGFGTDHQAAYVAASGVYQDSVLAPWTDLGRQVDELNANRRVTVVRELY